MDANTIGRMLSEAMTPNSGRGFWIRMLDHAASCLIGATIYWPLWNYLIADLHGMPHANWGQIATILALVRRPPES